MSIKEKENNKEPLFRCLVCGTSRKDLKYFLRNKAIICEYDDRVIEPEFLRKSKTNFDKQSFPRKEIQDE